MSNPESDDMRRMNRRQFVRNAGLGAVGLTAMGALAACGGSDSGSESSAGADTAAADTAAAATEEVAPYQGTLRIVGLGVDLIDPIKAAFEAATPGVTLEFTVKSTPEITQLALTQPDSFDIMSGYYHQLDQIWPSGNLQAIPTAGMTRFSEISPLISDGKLSENNNPGQGDAPFRKLFANSNTELAGEGNKTDMITMVPANHNSDSFGYNEKELGEQTSWGIMFAPEVKGKVALIDDPEIGLMDAAMAAEAAGVMTFVDKGNMTKEEIDEIMSFLISKKKEGWFRGFWATFDESVNFMSSGEVLVESMWSPAVSLLQAQDFPVRYAAPTEGYRGWGGGNSIFSHVAEDPSKQAAALAYLNWWNTPEPAGIMAAQGYYNAVINSSYEGLGAFPDGEAYQGYYLDGAAATTTLNDPFGQPTITEGEVRDGGSYEERCGNFAVWNSRMDEADYLTQKWQEFKSA